MKEKFGTFLGLMFIGWIASVFVLQIAVFAAILVIGHNNIRANPTDWYLTIMAISIPIGVVFALWKFPFGRPQ